MLHITFLVHSHPDLIFEIRIQLYITSFFSVFTPNSQRRPATYQLYVTSFLSVLTPSFQTPESSQMLYVTSFLSVLTP